MKQAYLITYGSKAFYALLDTAVASHEWDEVNRHTRRLMGMRDTNLDSPSFHMLNANQVYRGVFWTETLTSPDGMSFHLLPSELATEADIEACVTHLKSNRDVHRIKVQRIKKWLGSKMSGHLESDRFRFIAKILAFDLGFHLHMSDFDPECDLLKLGLDDHGCTELVREVETHYGIELDESALRGLASEGKIPEGTVIPIRLILAELDRLLGPEFPDEHGLLQLTDEQFDNRYDPERHPDGSGPVQREWYEDEALIQLAIAEKRCWTAVTGDDGQFVITWGNRVVDRLYNIITNRPIENEDWHVEAIDPDEERDENGYLIS